MWLYACYVDVLRESSLVDKQIDTQDVKEHKRWLFHFLNKDEIMKIIITIVPKLNTTFKSFLQSEPS